GALVVAERVIDGAGEALLGGEQHGELRVDGGRVRRRGEHVVAGADDELRRLRGDLLEEAGDDGLRIVRGVVRLLRAHVAEDGEAEGAGRVGRRRRAAGVGHVGERRGRRAADERAQEEDRRRALMHAVECAVHRDAFKVFLLFRRQKNYEGAAQGATYTHTQEGSTMLFR